MTSHNDFDSYAAARWEPLVRTAYMLGCTSTEAEDLVQDVLATVYRKWKAVAATENPDSYVYRMLVNAFRRSRRRRWHSEKPHPAVAGLVETAADEGEEAASVLRIDMRRALDQLPPDQRNVIVLKYLQDLPNEQIAQILKVPTGTVKSRAHRGLAQLQGAMTPVTARKAQQ